MTSIEFATMPVAEKIHLMETRWDSLSSEEAVVPDWHQEVLAARCELLDRDEESLSTLEEAKQRIRNMLGKQWALPPHTIQTLSLHCLLSDVC